MTHYLRLSMNFDRTTGRFHHYEVWLASKRSAFVAHVADLIPGTTPEQAKAISIELIPGTVLRVGA